LALFDPRGSNPRIGCHSSHRSPKLSLRALHRSTPSALGRAFFFPSLVDWLRQCFEPFTRAVKFRAFFELLKSVFGIGTSLGCTIPRVALGSDGVPNLCRAWPWVLHRRFPPGLMISLIQISISASDIPGLRLTAMRRLCPLS
jgi:hypothetical protein